MVTGEQPARISVRVQPNAKRTELVGFDDGVLHLKIAAPPVKGKANAALLAFLSDILGVSKSRLSIAKGATSRSKVIVIDGMSQEEVLLSLRP
ncbi:MAG TPA: YggU family protein [Dehalococcoidia bacterium]|nr:YggU family protein [Dehalococcoidia bacterium]